MKYLIFLLLVLFTISINAQNQKTAKGCTLEMTKKYLLSEKINFDCNSYKSKKIISFGIKIPKHKTLKVKGNQLYGKAKKLINSLNSGDSIVIINAKTENGETLTPILIKLVD